MKISQKTRSLFWIALVVCVLALSWIGLAQFYPETNTLRYLPDRIFRIVKILTGSDPIGSAVEPENVPVALIIVKILITLFLLRALLKIVESVFHEQYTQLRIACKTGHLIVLGIGNRGSRILKDYQAQTHQTAVAIEPKNDHENLPALRRDGHAIVIGNASDAETLKTAGALKAKTVICFDENEHTSIQAAGILATLAANRRAPYPLQCFVHLNNPRLVEIFRHHAQQQGARSLDIRFFNLHKMIARQFFHHLPGLLADTLHRPDANIRFLLFGFGPSAQALLIQAMRVFHLLPGQSSHWHIFAANIATERARFHDHYPQIGQITSLQFSEDTGCYAQLLLQATAHQPDNAQTVVICAGEDEHVNLLAAAELLSASATQDFPIFLRNASSQAMSRLLSQQANTRLHFFGDDDDFCKYELITGARQDDLARAIHNDYLRQIRGGASESTAYQTAWDELSEEAKDANRAQADHIIYKLLLTGRPEVIQSPADLQFNPQEIEMLAMVEHERWAAHRYLNGWQYGEKRDDIHKRHPSLSAWETLSDGEKQKDRDTILRLPQILHAVQNRVLSI